MWPENQLFEGMLGNLTLWNNKDTPLLQTHLENLSRNIYSEEWLLSIECLWPSIPSVFSNLDFFNPIQKIFHSEFSITFIINLFQYFRVSVISTQKFFLKILLIFNLFALDNLYIDVQIFTYLYTKKNFQDFVPIFLSKELLILSLILSSTKEDTWYEKN